MLRLKLCLGILKYMIKCIIIEMPKRHGAESKIGIRHHNRRRL